MRLIKHKQCPSPQTLNLYTYCGNDPINHTDPSGLFWGAIGRFFKKVLKILAFVALVVAVVVLTYVTFGIAAAAILGGVLAIKLGAYIYSNINEFLNECRVPKYGELSIGRQEELAQRGVSPEQWDSLKNKQRLGYL